MQNIKPHSVEGYADWTEYRAAHYEPVIVSPRGLPTNHHWTADGLIGERVRPEEAQFFIVQTTTIKRA